MGSTTRRRTVFRERVRVPSGAVGVPPRPGQDDGGVAARPAALRGSATRPPQSACARGARLLQTCAREASPCHQRGGRSSLAWRHPAAWLLGVVAGRRVAPGWWPRRAAPTAAAGRGSRRGAGVAVHGGRARPPRHGPATPGLAARWAWPPEGRARRSGAVAGRSVGGTQAQARARSSAQQALASDGEQPTLLRRFGCSPRLKRSVRSQVSVYHS